MDTRRVSDAAVVRRQSLTPFELLRRLRNPSVPVAGLLFDLGGVLFDDTVWPRWLLKLVGHLGLHTHYTPFFRLWKREYLVRVRRGELEYWPALRQFLRSAGLSHRQIDEVEAAGQGRRRALENDIFPLPGVVHVLTRLRDIGISMSVFSHCCCDTAGAARRLQQLGLTPYFGDVRSAHDLRLAYESQSCFELVAASDHMDPSQLCYVGRETEALAAASAVGLRTVAVNYDDDAEADVYLDHIGQLLGALPWEPARAMVG